LAGYSGLSTVFDFAGAVRFAGLIIFFDSRNTVIGVEPFAEVYQFTAAAAEGVNLMFPAALSGDIIDNSAAYWTSAFHIASQFTIILS
jgi:hypothetical protein